jgi:hypothetical protein
MENRKPDFTTSEDKEFKLFEFTFAQRIVIAIFLAVVAFLVYYGATVLFFGEDFWRESLAPGRSLNQ